MWGIARAYGGHVLLRIEDHDQTRCRAEYESALLDDLDWLGFVPDSGTTREFRSGKHGHRQSDNPARYESALSALQRDGLLYPCTCSRAVIARANGESDGAEMRYPGTCRNAGIDGATTPARRVLLAPHAIEFQDMRLGHQRQEPFRQCGDFLLRDRVGQFTYQLAVVADDIAQDIGVIVRGEDLLASTGRQFQLAAMLGSMSRPLTLHHALLRRPDGLKLSKSLGDTGVGELRDAGLTAAHVLGRAAYAAGLIPRDVPFEQENVAALFAA